MAVVSHAEGLAEALRDEAGAIELEREAIATTVLEQLPLEGPAWSSPAR